MLRISDIFISVKLFEILKIVVRSIFNLISSSDSNLKYSNLSLYDLKLIFDEFIYPTHLVIIILVNNLCTLSIWYMRLRNY